MQLSLNIQLTLSIVLGTMLVLDLGSAIAEIPEKSQTDSLLLSTEELDSASRKEPDPVQKEPGNAGDPDDLDGEADHSSEYPFTCPENDTSARCKPMP